MAFTHVQTKGGQFEVTGENAVYTLDSTATAGNVLVVLLLVADTGSPVTEVPTLTGFGNPVYDSTTLVSGRYLIWRKIATGTETAVTVVPANANDTLIIGGVEEMSFTGGALGLDDADSAVGSSNAPATPSLTVTGTSEAIIAVCFDLDGGAAITAGTGFTSRHTSSDILPIMLETKTGVNASQTAAFTMNNSEGWAALAVLLKTVVPSAPSVLQANPVGPTEIELHWTDNDGNETGYDLDYDTAANFGGATTVHPGALKTIYGVTGLTAEQTYYFRLRATLNGGASSYSNMATAKTYWLAVHR